MQVRDGGWVNFREMLVHTSVETERNYWGKPSQLILLTLLGRPEVKGFE
jgi:hypothetical protein